MPLWYSEIQKIHLLYCKVKVKDSLKTYFLFKISKLNLFPFFRCHYLLQHKVVQCTWQNKTSDNSLSKFPKMNSLVELNLMIENCNTHCGF